jgi:hypothetical protein
MPTLRGSNSLRCYIGSMDPNIKLAASYLRQAAATMRSRINEIRGGELNEKRDEGQEETRITQNLRQNEFSIANNDSDKYKDQNQAIRDSAKLAMQDRELRKNRDQLKNNLDHRMAEEEKEIRSLQDQIQKLDELARTLEWWRG